MFWRKQQMNHSKSSHKSWAFILDGRKPEVSTKCICKNGFLIASVRPTLFCVMSFCPCFLSLCSKKSGKDVLKTHFISKKAYQGRSSTLNLYIHTPDAEVTLVFDWNAGLIMSRSKATLNSGNDVSWARFLFWRLSSGAREEAAEESERETRCSKLSQRLIKQEIKVGAATERNNGQ